ncbi:hypothetical protein [Arthrobacter pityocampae]|uniref:hypothetical protein n=1 Tax=Arthrobacter pityocampae TaxID=547334 RepID=UPI0011B0C9DD|nr:hypothetical protein [Arthrobacter pityocampae]
MTYPDTAAAIIISVYETSTHSQIGTLLMKVGLGPYDPGNETRGGQGINKEKRLTTAIQTAPSAVREKALARLTVKLCNERAATERPEWLDELVEELRLADLSLHGDAVEVKRYDWSDPETQFTWRLGPLGADEIPVTAQAGQLEALLTNHNLPVAANHYAQAFESFKAGSLEASNGQLRAALENTLVSLTTRATGWSGGPGGSAIDTLNGKGYFADGEHNYFVGIWKISHGQGAHPGLTTEAEAEFRFHAITAAIYFLVHRLT